MEFLLVLIGNLFGTFFKRSKNGTGVDNGMIDQRFADKVRLFRMGRLVELNFFDNFLENKKNDKVLE